MRISFELVADPRDGVQGKSASRRLRRSGKVPAILYGGKQPPRLITLDHQNLLTLLDNERFYSTIIALKVNGETYPAILKDVQRHPAKNQILHLDLQRVLEDEPLHMRVPLHFVGGANAPGVKSQGGLVSHLLNDVLVECLPKDLPEYITVDLSSMVLNEIKRLSDLELPPGVTLVDLAHGRNLPVVVIHPPRAAEEAEPAAEQAAGASNAAAGGAAKK
ncbi:MAG: 50S ribosomal protein L25/general stress protein Ctc [Gammaproteobacteria bacterium]|nr:50S ribosomal protein L25 [Gammaproteobacteria bacterium]